jgi:hypothetical protein
MVTFSNSLEEDREDVGLIIAKLYEVGCYLKLLKCKFKMQQISFIGFVVMPECVEMELARVRTIAMWPEPTCHHDIQVFLGFANFYRRFISSFSCLTKSITDMLKEGNDGHFLGPFLPTLAMKQSFAGLCNTFTKALMQAQFDLVKPICFKSNASEFAIAGIILW